MWEGQVRTDGLLRGSRDERMQQMVALKNSTWRLDALLDLHCGLLDHAHDVREAAMETLLDLAARKPIAIPITPSTLLAYYISTFTVASGIDLAVVTCLAELRTAEADDLLLDLLLSGRGSIASNSPLVTVAGGSAVPSTVAETESGPACSCS